MDIVVYKGNRFFTTGFFDIKLFQKEQNKYAYIPQKSNHRKHTLKNYVLNELKRYVKFNSNKLLFLKLRNKFFDRLRNRGFKKYSLTKLFRVVSYSSRKTLLFKNTPAQYSNVFQETEAENVMMVMAEKIFSQNTEEAEAIKETEADTVVATEDNSISSKDKVGFSIHSKNQKNEKSKMDFSLCIVLPGECYELKKDISAIFEAEKSKFNLRSQRFNKCFESFNIDAIYLNEPKISNYIVKNKL